MVTERSTPRTSSSPSATIAEYPLLRATDTVGVRVALDPKFVRDPDARVVVCGVVRNVAGAARLSATCEHRSRPGRDTVNDEPADGEESEKHPELAGGVTSAGHPKRRHPADGLRSWGTERARWLATVSSQPTPIREADMSLSDREPPRAFEGLFAAPVSHPSTTRDSLPGPCSTIVTLPDWMTVSAGVTMRLSE